MSPVSLSGDFVAELGVPLSVVPQLICHSNLNASTDPSGQNKGHAAPLQGLAAPQDIRKGFSNLLSSGAPHFLTQKPQPNELSPSLTANASGRSIRRCQRGCVSLNSRLSKSVYRCVILSAIHILSYTRPSRRLSVDAGRTCLSRLSDRFHHYGYERYQTLNLPQRVRSVDTIRYADESPASHGQGKARQTLEASYTCFI